MVAAHPITTVLVAGRGTRLNGISFFCARFGLFGYRRHISIYLDRQKNASIPDRFLLQPVSPRLLFEAVLWQAL
jgi:hypothetical protein